MASRYWVSAINDTWDNTAGLKWATTSGGTPGASVPGTGDDVHFDANSTGTCTKGATALTLGSLDMTGSNCTIAWASRAITVDTGDFKLVSAKCSGSITTLTMLGSGDQVLTTDGFTGFSTGVTHAGGTTSQKLTLGDDLTCPTFTKSRGTLVLNGKTLTASTKFTTSANALVKNVTWDTGTIKTPIFDVSPGTNLTITTTAGSGVLQDNGASLTVTAMFTLPAVIVNGGTLTANGGPTLYSLDINTPSGGGGLNIQASTTLTVLNGCRIQGGAGGALANVLSTIAATQATLAVANYNPYLAAASFQDVVCTGIIPFRGIKGSSDAGGNNTDFLVTGERTSHRLLGLGV